MCLQGWCRPPWCEHHRGLGRIAARRSPAAWPRPARCPRTSQGLCLDGETSRLGQDGAEAAPTRRVPRPPGLLVWTFKAETVTRAGLATQLPRAYSSVPAAVTNIRVSAQFTLTHIPPRPVEGPCLSGHSGARLRLCIGAHVCTRARPALGRGGPQSPQAEPGPAPQPRRPQPRPAAPPALCRPRAAPPASSAQFLCDVVVVLLTLACCV